jgi:hypothetical protein
MGNPEYYLFLILLLLSCILFISLFGLWLFDNRAHKRQVGPLGVRSLSITEQLHSSREWSLSGHSNISMLLETGNDRLNFSLTESGRN